MVDGAGAGGKVAAIKKAADDLFTSVDNLKQSISRVGDATEAAKGGFQGSAAGAYNTAIDTWSAETTDINHKLDGFTQEITAALNHIGGLEDETVDSFKAYDSSNGGGGTHTTL